MRQTDSRSSWSVSAPPAAAAAAAALRSTAGKLVHKAPSMSSAAAQLKGQCHLNVQQQRRQRPVRSTPQQQSDQVTEDLVHMETQLIYLFFFLLEKFSVNTGKQ